MNPFAHLLDLVTGVLDGLEAEGTLVAGLDRTRITVDPTRDPAHGEAATNAALILAKPAGQKPLALAERIASALAGGPEVDSVAVAPPGFVNLTLRPSFWQRHVRAVLMAGEEHGRSTIGAGTRVNVEYCSANPTGPLHVGHGRGTVFGDALASVLSFAGYDVTREYYINDGGAQIDALARTIHWRYREALGEPPGPMPEGGYPGAYVIPVARDIASRDGRLWLDLPEENWLEPFREEGVAAMMRLVREDLAALGVHHQVFTSERSLIEAGAIEAVLSDLEANGLIYTGTLPPPKGKPVDDWEPVPQLLFRSTAYGDEIDRPLKRSNGAWTYFAADVAYHRDKVRRGFPLLIDVLGADHGGYVKRMQAAVRALSHDQAQLDVRLCQLVNLMDEGKPLKMSKRAGRIVTLRDVVNEVGRDVVRFIMLTRKNDASLDFDLARVMEQSQDPPVFYVQYAHARICSVFRKLEDEGMTELAPHLEHAAVERLLDPAELTLLRQLASWPRTVEGAAQNFEPHRIAFYLHELASSFHLLWSRGNEEPRLRFLNPQDVDLTRARLAMLEAVRVVIARGLGLMGVQPLAEMR